MSWKGLASALFLTAIAAAAFLSAFPVGPAFAQGYTLTVGTDSSSYFGSQQAVISGNVYPAPGTGTSVALSVYNPQGQLARAASASVDGSTGAYSYAFTVGGSDWTNGAYVVDATWSQSLTAAAVHASATFTYTVNQTSGATTSTTSSTAASSTTSSAPSTSTTASSAPATSDSTLTSAAGGTSTTVSAAAGTSTAIVIAPSGEGNYTFSDQLGSVTLDVTGGTSITGAGLALTVTVLQPASPHASTYISIAGTTVLPMTNLVGVLDVRANSSSSGVALFCVSSPAVDGGTVVVYWDGTAWVVAGQVSVSGTRVCGILPLAALWGTPVAAGDLAASPSSTSATIAPTTTAAPIIGGTTTTSPTQYALPVSYPLLAGAATVVLVLAVAGVMARRRRWWS